MRGPQGHSLAPTPRPPPPTSRRPPDPYNLSTNSTAAVRCIGRKAPAIGSNLRMVGIKERRRNGKEMPQFLVLHHFWFSLSPVGNNVGKGFTPFPRHLSPPSIHRHIRDLRRRTGYTCTILGSAGAYIRDRVITFVT